MQTKLIKAVGDQYLLVIPDSLLQQLGWDGDTDLHVSIKNGNIQIRKAQSYIVDDLIKTCSAYPSQWEGITKCGKDIYIRYRWGSLTLDIDGITVYSLSKGDGLDGYLDDSEMREALKDFLVFQ